MDTDKYKSIALNMETYKKLREMSDKKFEMISLVNNRYESVKNMAKRKILEFK